MRGYRFELLCIVGLVGCGFERPDDVEEQFRVGGEVAGMWDGGALTLRLEATGVDELLTVDANEPFQFETPIDDGSSFTVTLGTAPTAHDCAVADGAAVLAGSDYDQVRVACTGPAVDVTLSAPVDWSFDPDLVNQFVELSLLVQQVALTVTADDATLIRIDTEDLASGAPSTQRPLALGPNSVAIEVHVDTVSRVFDLTLDRTARPIEQDAYVKASNTGEGDAFGTAVAVSGDLLAVGAPGEDSATTIINGPQNNETAGEAGAVYVFRRAGGAWQQIAYIKASNAGATDGFGKSVALDGNTLVVGAPAEDGPTNNITDCGAAYVYTFDTVTGMWRQDAVLRASDAFGNQRFGQSVAVSGDAVAVGMNGDLGAVGAVYVFRRNGANWPQEDRIQGSESANSDSFGFDVSLEGNLLGVGSPAFTGDKAYLFRFSGSDWVEEAILRAGVAGDFFGLDLAVSGDRAVVAAYGDNSNGRGVNPTTTGTATLSGAAYVFAKQGATWSQEAFIKSSNSDAEDWFGVDVALVGDVLVVTTQYEDSAGTGVNADETDNSAALAGAAYVFHREDAVWSQEFYVKSSNAESGDLFGVVALSLDRLVVSATGDDSDATGVGGSQGNNASTEGSGAVYAIR